MENLTDGSAEVLFEDSLENLHLQSEQWVEEVGLWKNELQFFQKILDRYSGCFNTTEQKKTLDHFQHIITYYSGQLLDDFKQRVRRHEKYLRGIMDGEEPNMESEFRARHSSLFELINSFRHEYNNYKQDLFHTMEGIM
ncbi:MAG: hypothetical protein AAFX87_17430 [Bacteroidota bacterium]